MFVCLFWGGGVHGKAASLVNAVKLENFVLCQIFFFFFFARNQTAIYLFIYLFFFFLFLKMEAERRKMNLP